MDARQGAASRPAPSPPAAPLASPFAPTSTPFIPPPALPTSTPSQHVSPTVPDASRAALHAVPPPPPPPPQPEIVHACETLINVARSLNARPMYDIQRVGGEDHQPLFHASVELYPQGYVARGVGRSKMACRRDAASNMLRQIYSKTVQQPPAMPPVSAATASQPISQPMSQPQVNMLDPSTYPLQSHSFSSNYASYSQPASHPAHPSMSQPSMPQQAPPLGSQPFRAIKQQPQLPSPTQQPIAQHTQYHQSPSSSLAPQPFQPQQHSFSPQSQPPPQSQQPPQPQSQSHPQLSLHLQPQPKQQPQLVQQYQVQPQHSLAQQQSLQQQQSSYIPMPDRQHQPPPPLPPPQEEPPMFYVDRSPDSDLERELEEEEERKQQQERNPAETPAVDTAVPPASPPAPATSKPATPPTSNTAPPPVSTVPPVPRAEALLTQPQAKQPTVAVAATSTAVGTITAADPSASLGQAQQVGPASSDAPTTSVPPTSALPNAEKVQGNERAPSTARASGSTTQTIVKQEPAEPQAQSIANALATKRVPDPVSQTPATLHSASSPKIGNSDGTSAVAPSGLSRVEPSAAQTTLKASSKSESGSTAPSTLKRKLEEDESVPRANGNGNFAVATQRQRKKARGLSTHPPVRLDFHFLCVLDEQVRKSLEDLMKADLFIRPHIHLFSSNDVTTPMQLASGLSVPVTPFDQNVSERQELVPMVLAFEAGSLCNDLWIERAKHLAKGLPGSLMPRMIILSDNPLFEAFVKKGVIDVVNPKDDLAKFASEILQQSSCSEEKAME